MRETPALLTTIKGNHLVALYIRLECITLNLNFGGGVVCPESAVASADGAETFVGGGAEGWEGEPDGGAVAG